VAARTYAIAAQHDDEREHRSAQRCFGEPADQHRGTDYNSPRESQPESVAL
jgi:hypothetical protein